MKRMMKKAMSLLLVMALVLSLAPMAFAAGTPTIKVGTGTADITGLAASATTSVIVPVKIENNPGFAGMDLVFDVPDGWTIGEIDTDYTGTDMVNCSVFCELSYMEFMGMQIPQVRQFTLPTVNPAAGSFIPAFNGLNGTAETADGLIHADGFLCWLTINVPGGLVDGDYDVTVNAKWINDTNTAVDMSEQFTLVNGTVTVTGGISAEGLKPSITADPESATYTYAATAPAVAPLSVTVAEPANGTLTYQWYKNGTAIDGATNTTYTPALPAIGTSDSYHCVVTNSFAGMTSSATSKTAVIEYAKAALADAMLTLEKTEVKYTGHEVNPGAAVTGLTAADYTITGDSATAVGNYTVKVTGKGNYTGEITKGWKVVAADLTEVNAPNVSAIVGGKVALAASAKTVDGSAVKYAYTVKSGDCITLADTEVTAVKEGTATIEVVMTAENHNAVTKTFTFTVQSKNPAVVTFADAADKVYTPNGYVLGEQFTAATVDVDADPAANITYYYNGTAYETLADLKAKVTEAGVYTVEAVYETATHKGSAKAEFEITKADQDALTINQSAGTYGKTLELTTTGGSGTGDVTYAVVEGNATISGNKLTAGAAGTVKVVATKAADNNYKVVESAAKEITFAQAAAPAGIAGVSANYKFSVTGAQTVSITGVPADAGAVTYNPGEVTGNTGIVSNVSVSNKGVVSFTLTGAGAAGNTATIPVTVAMTNYVSKIVNVVITLTDKDAPTLKVADIRVTYTGEALTAADIDGEATFGGKAVAGDWSFVDYDAATMVDAGEYEVTVKFTPKDSVNYDEATAKIAITVDKADLVGEPSYVFVKVSGKTLADALLSFGDLAADGTIEWIDENGNVLPASTKIDANKVYTWRYTPADTNNYNVITGTVVLYKYSSSVDVPFYNINLPKDENLTITTTASRAPEGATVTLTIKAAEGYEVEYVEVEDAEGDEIAVKALGNDKYSFKMPDCDVAVTVEYDEASAGKGDQDDKFYFIDVYANDWFYDEVYYAYDNGLMNGIGDNMFGPTNDLTRGMLMTILARLDGVNTNGGAVWYTKGMEWAVENGISDGTMPEANITREQAVTMLYRFAQHKGVDVSVGEDTNILSYEDAFSVSEWAIPAMQWACGDGMIQGNEGKLNPNGTATRAEIATMLMRFIETVL